MIKNIQPLDFANHHNQHDHDTHSNNSNQGTLHKACHHHHPHLFHQMKTILAKLSSQPANINDRLNQAGSLLGTEPLVLLVLVTRSHHLDHLHVGVSAEVLSSLIITSSSFRLNVLCWS